jgi:hypothetical protein
MDCSISSREHFPSAKLPGELAERKIFRESFREIPRTIGGNPSIAGFSRRRVGDYMVFVGGCNINIGLP